MSTQTEARSPEEIAWDGRFDKNPLQSDDTTSDTVHEGDEEVTEQVQLEDAGDVPEGAQLSFLVGGKPPTGSFLSITGASKLGTPEHFEKGAELEVTLHVKVVEVAFADEEDRETAQVVSTDRTAKAKFVQLVDVKVKS